MKKLISILLIVAPFFSYAQQSTPNKRLKVFIDCSNTRCDFTFIRSEINIVDFLRDQDAADVHVLITDQRNGSGGNSYQIIFYGRKTFKNFQDTLTFQTGALATDVERREAMVKNLKLGLVPLILRTGQKDKIQISMKVDQKPGEEVDEEREDKWNYWVFRLRGNGFIRGDKVYSSKSLGAGFSADRTTDKSRVNFNLNTGYDYSSYTYETDSGTTDKTVVKNNDYRFEHFLIQGINDHWSVGYDTYLSNNSFSNNKQRIYLATAIEYNFFPYKDVNNKLVTLSYNLDLRHNTYYDTTIYNKTREFLVGHSVLLSISLNQRWGNISTGIRYHNYFNDWKLTNLSAETDMEVRITGNLSFNTFFYGGIIHDQVYLSGEGATQDEVLTRRRELESSYTIRIFFGLTYRFGSKVNNFVNARFQGDANNDF